MSICWEEIEDLISYGGGGQTGLIYTAPSSALVAGNYKNNKVHFEDLKFHPDELASRLDDPTSRLGVLEKAHTSYCCAYLFLLHWRRSSGALYFLGLPVVN